MKTQLELVLLFLCVARGVFPVSVSGKTCTEDDLGMYSGNVSITNGGRICQNWTSQSPHAHLFSYNGYFPLDRTIKDAANYCRNVDGNSMPWCFTTDQRRRWDYCNETICGEPVCGGILSKPTGVIVWPAAYGEYDRRVDCLWTIVAPEDMRIEFEVTRMDIEHQRVCFNSYIAIYDHTRHYGRYCGTKNPPLIRSRSTTLYIRFDSESERSSAGFNASYSQVEKANETTEDPENLQDYPVGDVMCPAGVDIGLYTGKVNVTESGRTCMHWKDTSVEPQRWSAEDENFCRNIGYVVPWCKTIDGEYEYCHENICKGAACGGNVTTPSGWLSGIDGDKDGDYNVFRKCLWTLIAPVDHGIVVQIKFLSIAYATECEFEKLEIYANVLEIKRFCGTLLSLPVTLRFKSNLLFVYFKSWFAELPGPGFNMSYVHVAAVNITTTTEATVSETPAVTDDQQSPAIEPETTEVKLGKIVRTQSTLFSTGFTERKGSGCVRMSASHISFKLMVIGWIMLFITHCFAC